MEKVLQILAVFVLMMLIIWRSVRRREERFRRFSYLGRMRPPLPEEVRIRLVEGTFGPDEGREAFGVSGRTDGFLWEEDSRLLLSYQAEGKLQIYRRAASGRERLLQELAAPMDCTRLGWDRLDRKIYLEEGGDWFVYGEEGD
jgi:hypothetical protein